MCVAAIAWDAHPRWRLVVAANRDEFHDRAAAPLHRWADGIIAGRDLRSGGTWLGVNAAGGCVLVTNLRADGYPLPDRPSRGALVTDLLGGADPLRIAIAPYNPFNLFRADRAAAQVLTNHPAAIRLAATSGVHGLSNGPHDRPWPKTTRLCAALADWLAGEAQDVAALFPALGDAAPLDRIAHEGPYPDPRFSAVFIRDPAYGTRCSTVLAIGRDGHGTIVERSFDPAGDPAGEVTIGFSAP